MKRETWAVLIVLLLAGAAAYAHATNTTEDYSRYNVGWNGTSNFAGREVRDPGAPILILAPDRPFTAEDVGYLQAFLSDGGRVIIADEDGNANRLLADLGSSMRIRPGNLASLDRDHADPGLLIARVVENDTLFAGVETIRTNRPAAVEGGDPLLETSILTWEDYDGDGRISGSEIFGTAVICAREGNLTVIGDASLFINAMLAENPQFIENIGPVRIDAHSGTGTTNRIINTRLWIQETPLAPAAVAAIAVLPVAWHFGKKRGQLPRTLGRAWERLNETEQLD